ncbi:methionyl-tRNA formyltransferase [bacterium]|nr:methionyl-tRNA formyltransferase [bacterium]
MKNEKNMNTNNYRWAFFGTDPLAVPILHELEAAGFVPACVIAGHDVPGRRGAPPTPPPEKQWADERGVTVVRPDKIDNEFLSMLTKEEWDFFIVASYGKILPNELLAIPSKGVINVHPSLLPRLRGPSPIRSAILTDERKTGVTVMVMDSKMDHGPIIAQKIVPVPDWPPYGRVLDALLAKEGAQLLAQALPQYLSGEITPQEQQHDVATYCHFLKKEDAYIDLSEDAYKNLLKTRGYDGWPGAYTIMNVHGKDIRVKILSAEIDNSILLLDRVVPEGKHEMSYAEFEKNIIDKR